MAEDLVLKPRPLTRRSGEKRKSKRKSWPVTALTDELITEFMVWVKKGIPLDAICDYLSIDNGVFWKWVREGEKWIKGDGEPPDKERCGAFVVELKKSSAEYRMRLIKELHDKNNLSWSKQLAILSRRDRKNFGVTEIQGGDDSSFNPDERFL